MNARMIMLSSVIVAVMSCGADCGTNACSDVEARRIVIRSTGYFDSPQAIRSDMEYALRCCGDDTNRFAAILRDIARSETNLTASMISKLGRYGTTNSLPFLYGYVTNAAYGLNAVRSVLKIEGVTSNSVERISEFLANTNVSFSTRSDVCADMVWDAFKDDVSPANRALAVDRAIQYASTANGSCSWLDKVMCKKVPSYKMSKRRLCVLRSVYAIGVGQYEIAYVTNAINELAAYPEANLPE